MQAVMLEVMAATWPAASTRRLGPVVLREGAGGGKRVSAATLAEGWTGADLDRAIAVMPEPLFLLSEADGEASRALAARGLVEIEAVRLLRAPIATLLQACAATSGGLECMGFAHWPPLAITRDLWAAAGIGPARLAVMERVQLPRTALLGRLGDRPAAAAFVASLGEEAMLHALEVSPFARRQGLGRAMMRDAARWAEAAGARHLSLQVTWQNHAALALYRGLGMVDVGGYHYLGRR